MRIVRGEDGYLIRVTSAEFALLRSLVALGQDRLGGSTSSSWSAAMIGAWTRRTKGGAFMRVDAGPSLERVRLGCGHEVELPRHGRRRRLARMRCASCLAAGRV